MPPGLRYQSNLCKKSVEAMRDGGTLTLRGYATEEWLCLDIADTGENMPEGGVANKPQGGLGLPIA